eukprot:262819-Amphidinium_carterae.1
MPRPVWWPEIGAWGQLEATFFPDDAFGAYWTEHSARATMATMASAAGIQLEVVRRMGRWKGE